MGNYTRQGSDNYHSQAYANMPTTSSSKGHLIELIQQGFEECRRMDIPIDFKWIRYFTGWDAGCGEIYIITRDYANQIGYSGPITYKDSDFIVANGKYFDLLGSDLSIKSTKKSVPSFTEQVNQIRKDNMSGLRAQYKAEVLSKLDDLYHSYLELADYFNQAGPDTQIRSVLDKCYDSIVDVNKQINQIYEEW